MNRKPKTAPNLPLFDEAFLRRLERLNFRTVPSLRGSILGDRRSRNLRASLDFSDHRPYSIGDDLRHVDWNAYARHEALVVKLSESTQSVDVHILLDRSPSMGGVVDFGFGIGDFGLKGEDIQNPKSKIQNGDVQNPKSKWDGARRLAGALSYLALAGGEKLYLTPFAETLDKGFGPTRGKKQIIPTLQFLTSVTVNESMTTVNSLTSLADMARLYPNGGLLVLLSDLLDTATPEVGLPQVEVSKKAEVWLTDKRETTAKKLAEGLRYLTPPRWQVLVVHLLMEQEVEPTFVGDLDLRDMETGETLPFHFDQATLTEYQGRVRRWCTELQSACAQRGATYTRVLVEWPLEKIVIPYLRQRGVVQ